MSANEIHVGDVGTIFRVTIKDDATVVNVSSATTKQLIFSKPDGTNLVKTAEFYTTGVDGIIQYTTVSGDLDTEGQWRIQAYVIMPAGSWKSDVAKFVVYTNL